MENQINIVDQNTQQIGQNPVNQPVEIPKKIKVSKLLPLITLVALFFGLGASVYLTQQRQYIRGKAAEPPKTSTLNVTASIQPIETVVIDSQATGYGTFESHNQKVVANQYGIFMTHLHSRNEAYDQNTWRFSRSTDGGKTFSTIYESTNGTSAPAIETDSTGTIYLAHPDWGVGYKETNAYLYRFTPQNNFTNPTKTVIPNSAAGKYTMMIDEPRGQLYFLAHNGTFSILGLNGDVRRNYQLLTGGSSAYQAYPLLYLDANGDLYAAWTTQKKDKYMYWDIHFMRSKDGGITWQKPNGQILTPPVIADETGPTDRITLDDEFDVHTWLWGFLVKNNKVHFAYQAQAIPSREHYVQFDLQTNKINRNIYPKWQGESQEIIGFDGFCASKSDIKDIYCTSMSTGPGGNGYRLVTLRSGNDGYTWHDYAVSDVIFGKSFYSIGGSRKITDDGYIIGSYTEGEKEVKFFRTKIVPVQDPPLFTKITTTGQINVLYQNPSALSGDWIGLYPQGETDEKKYLDWKWLDNTKKNQPSSVSSSGNVTLTAPRDGTYDIRYFTPDQSLSYPWKKIDTKTIDISGSTRPLCSNVVSTLKSLAPLRIYPNNIFFNWGGLNEKWFIDKNSTWYYILPSEKVQETSDKYKFKQGSYAIFRWKAGNQGLLRNGGNVGDDEFVISDDNKECYDAIKENYVFPSP